MSHFLALEGLIADRLRERLPSTVQVLTAADLAGVLEERQITPAVSLFFKGVKPLSSAGDWAQIAQHWVTVVTVRNVSHTRRGTGIAEDAGPLIDHVINALLGWRPAVGMRRLTLEQMPEAGYSGGFAYYPLVWGSVIQRSGAAHATPGTDN